MFINKIINRLFISLKQRYYKNTIYSDNIHVDSIFVFKKLPIRYERDVYKIQGSIWLWST